MRPVIVQVPSGEGRKVMEAAGNLEAKNTSLLKGSNAEQDLDVILTFISNRRVEPFTEAVNEINNAHITIFPQGVMTLYPPAEKAPDQVTNVEPRSPLEIFLSGLQSKGSWKGFISYAVIASIVVWIGLYTNTQFLLVAAMLIAPFAGPAMNTAIGTARGDVKLLKWSLFRYVVSILVTIFVAILLSLVMGQEITTTLMTDRSQISSVAVLLATVAGAAGAINLVQSERDSLVSGAATGMLIAASLAPPAGVVGMSIALGKWGMVESGVYVLILQLIGINLAGAIVFRLYGLRSTGSRYSRGKKSLFLSSSGITVLILGLLIWWQFNKSPSLQRSTTSKHASADIQSYIEKHPAVRLVETNVRFTRSETEGENPLLCVIYLQKTSSAAQSATELEQQLTEGIKKEVLQKGYNVTPLVQVNVLE